MSNYIGVKKWDFDVEERRHGYKINEIRLKHFFKLEVSVWIHNLA